MSTFLSIQHELASHGVDLHASELHGRLVGYLCATKAQTSNDKRHALYADWVGGSVPGALRSMLDAAYTSTVENLGDYSDFEFKLLIPDDDSPISERAAGVAQWCSGFLSGFGETGRRLEPGSEVAEAMTDLGRIARMTDDIPAGEDNEADLMEIIEFVRVSTLMIYAENQDGSVH